jgi:signal transduction histidine kinase
MKKDDLLIELRQNTFRLSLLFVGLSAAVMIWLGNIRARTSPPDVVLLWVALELCCVVAWWLRKRRLWLSMVVWLACVWALNTVSVYRFNLELSLYLFTAVSLLSSILANRRTSLVFSALSTLIILSQRDPGSQLQIALPLLMLWITQFTAFVAFHSLYQALDMAWNYQEYAVQQMREAREHRANLLTATKALNEARTDLARTNVQLIHAYRAAEEGRRLKAQFAANVSHELRTPINLIVGFSETIVTSPQSYGVPLPAAYWADMNTIYRSAKHLQSLINDVLDVSQIEAGKLAVVKEPIDSRQVLEEAVNIARDLIESRGLTFHVRLPDSMPVMYLDRTRIRQVLLNLLSNAARFTDSGTITLTALIDNGELRIIVQDMGIGIPKTDLARVFEEFHQVEGSLSRRWGGSGLGLTLSKQFVEHHGGRIWAQSEGIPGKGSTFIVALPLVDRSIALKHIPAITEAESNAGRYFVVMHADPAVVQLFTRYANRHQAVGANTWDEASRLVENIRPAALVTDIAHAERARLCADQTPVIACSMPTGQRIVTTNTRIAHLSEPITNEGLRDLIERVVPENLDYIQNVLIIAQDLDTVRMYTRMLQAITQTLPHEVGIWKAYSGEEGTELALQRPPDVILLAELHSPAERDEVLRRIESEPSLAHVGIIVRATDAVNGLTPADVGHIEVHRPVGFQLMELVMCVESLVEVLNPNPGTNPEKSSERSPSEIPLDSAAS